MLNFTCILHTHVCLFISVIYRCVPPTHEYGTRPFLRWARSQGRSPHASGKVKNTFSPVGIPLFGAPQAPGNKPNPTKRGYICYQTLDWPIYISTISSHVNSSGTIHFNTCVCWLEIRVQITRVAIGTFLYLTLYITNNSIKHHSFVYT